nr:hypothetical protein [Tanacetum cinerariifolium]
MQRNQSLRLQILKCHKTRKRIWVIMMKNPRERLYLNVTSSPNLNNLKNPLILIGMFARIHNKDLLKVVMTLASFADKPSKTFDELMSTPIDFLAYIMNGLKITNLTQETLLGPAFKHLKGTCTNFNELEYDFEECYKAISEKLNWDNPEVTQVKIMQKHRYEYLREIKVRRTDNKLYTFKEGDFLRLRINDIEDMLILVVQNRLTNLLGDDVSDFAIALRMFTRSMVVQKRVKDLQLGVKSY